jgi:hypothetical protein
MTRRGLTAIAALSLGVWAFSACGGDDGQGDAEPGGSPSAGDTASTAPEEQASAATDAATGSSSDGVWSGAIGPGMTLQAELWVDGTDADLAPFEAYRTTVGAPAVSYVRVVADNTRGSSDDTGRFLTFTDASGDLFGPSRVEAPFLCSVLSTRWAPASDAATETIEEYAELFNGPCADQAAQVVVPAGDSVTYYVAVEGQPPAFERLFAGVGNELSP